MPSHLQDEIRQTRPFASLEQEAYLGILRTAALLDHAVAEALKPHGITPTQYNVLRILRGAGAEGLPTLTVRARLIEEAPGITRLIDKLETAGLVQRDRTGKDRRTVRCRITTAGLDVLSRLDTDLAGWQGPVGAGLPEERDRAQLLALLQRVREGLRSGV
jgi:MarR family transcriptional regulator, organic hydroperoxide resistance regulator